ncbi:MAG: iron-containing alcohol dehydrogenase [Thermoanaerobacteraceae bacterium]|nr:iron-containing alcohol dehydrogenase [Thermoanaerobacteraceae bacterium]
MSFDVLLPTRIIFGRGKIEQISECRTYGDKALIVTGKYSSKKSGLLGKVLEILDNCTIPYVIYDEVISNPDCISVDKGVKVSTENRCNMVIALGGGSAIDTAKGIAVGSVELSPIWDFLRPDSRKRSVRGALPIIAVPTTSGTGSEVNGAAVIQNNEIGFKPSFKSIYTFPSLSIIDPEFMTTMDRSVTASTGVDAFCQALECFIGVKANEVSNIYALESIKLSYKYLKKAYDDGNNIEAREKMALAAMLSGLAMASSGTSLVHALEHPLSGRYNITHGVGLAALLPSFIEFSLKYNEEKYKKIASILRGKEVEASEIHTIIEEFLKSVGLKLRLRDLEIKEEDINILAKDTIMTLTGSIKNFNKPINEDDCKMIYKMAL